jgi:hypothetical protein
MNPLTLFNIATNLLTSLKIEKNPTVINSHQIEIFNAQIFLILKVLFLGNYFAIIYLISRRLVAILNKVRGFIA